MAVCLPENQGSRKIFSHILIWLEAHTTFSGLTQFIEMWFCKCFTLGGNPLPLLLKWLRGLLTRVCRIKVPSPDIRPKIKTIEHHWKPTWMPSNSLKLPHFGHRLSNVWIFLFGWSNLWAIFIYFHGEVFNLWVQWLWLVTKGWVAANCLSYHGGSRGEMIPFHHFFNGSSMAWGFWKNGKPGKTWQKWENMIGNQEMTCLSKPMILILPNVLFFNSHGLLN